MISILFFFANNRVSLFEKTVECLRGIALYDQCEKIVCSDGPTDFKHPDYKVIEVPRLRKDYNWSVVWAEGVKVASHEKMWYLDCDRVVPPNYLLEALPLLGDRQWVYPKNTLRISQDVDISTLKKIQNGELQHLIGQIEPRVDNPPNIVKSQPGKNPFSGNSLFTKSGFLESGGLNPAFDGYGYADIDYYMKMHKLGHRFVAAPLNEYHQWHPHAVSNERDQKMMYYNGLMYCQNWGLQPHEMLLYNSSKHNLQLNSVKANTEFARHERKLEVRML